MDSLDPQLARRSRRTGWLSLLGASLVFASIAYSSFTIARLRTKVDAFHEQIRLLDGQVRARNEEIEQKNREIEALKKDLADLGVEVEQKKHDIASLNDSLAKLNEARSSAAGLVLQILNIEHQVRVDSRVDWDQIRHQLLSVGAGKRQEAILTAILLAWKDVPFNMKGQHLVQGFNSTSFIKYVLRQVGIDINEQSGEHTSDAIVRLFRETENAEPGDLVCYRGDIGRFCLLVISVNDQGQALAGIGTLETTWPLGIYALSGINVSKYPMVGYLKVPYPS